jgi:hypothetical protein
MAKILSKSGIVTGHDVEAWHVTQSVDAFTKVDAYDITVSGSFTVTGSIKIRGNVSGRTSQTASLAITSSYAVFTPTVVSASRADYNISNQYTLQFYSPPNSTTISNNSLYGIGMGEALITPSGVYGITLPIDSIIVGTVVVVATSKAQGLMTSQLQLMSGDSNVEYTFTNSVQYKEPYEYFNEVVNLPSFPAGTRLWFKIGTDGGSKPTEPAHNIILTLQPL